MEAHKNPNMEQCIKAALEKYAKYIAKNTTSSTSDLIQFNDEQPLVSSSSFIVSISTRINNLPYDNSNSSNLESSPELSEYTD
jgi:hypothetical protein